MQKTVLFVLACPWLLTSCSSPERLPSIPVQADYVMTVNIQDHSLSFIDTESYEEKTWTLPFAFQRAVFLTEDQLLLYGKELDRAYVYELSSGKALGEWKTGKGIENMVLSADGTHVYAADQKRNSLRVFTLDGKQHEEMKLDSAPFTILESSDKLYVASYEEAYMSVILKSSWKTAGTFPAPPRSVGGWIDENKDELWLGGHGSGEQIQDDIYIYSLTDGTLKEKITTPVMPIDFARAQNHVYALSHGSNELWKIDYDTKRIEEKIETGSNPFSMKLFQDKLYIASYDSNKVQVVDLKTFQTIKQIPVGTGPFQLFVREEERA
ncbi:YVTN family beta-propeller protein [Bacillus fengqiuensis]|nr:YVTN family beta-propeller protein [Bacillus fengqiuensis]